MQQISAEETGTLGFKPCPKFSVSHMTSSEAGWEVRGILGQLWTNPVSLQL